MGILILLISMGWAVDTFRLATELSVVDTGDFTYLSETLEQQNFSDPQQFLQFWSESRPEYFANYVLAHRSRSLQESSPMAPRALIFNQNADLVLTFNGNPQHHGFDVVEMVHFNHQQKSFEFYELTFQQQRSVLSEANPGKCMACHQSSTRSNIDPRPNWEPYNIWPGFYGGFDDRMGFTNSPRIRRLRDQGETLLVRDAENEEVWLEQFRYEVQSSDPRYSLLSYEQVNQYGRVGRTLNGDLTNRLATLNFQRVARLMKENRVLWDKVKWTLWAHAVCDGRIYMPQDVFYWLYQQAPGSDWTRYNNRTRSLSASIVPVDSSETDEANLVDILSVNSPQHLNVRASDAIAVLFASFGISTEDWSMDFKTAGAQYAAFERFGVTNDPRPPWREAVRNEWATEDGFANLSCQEAKERSLQQWPGLEEVRQWRQEFMSGLPLIEETPLLNRCLQCHVHNSQSDYEGQIPHIAFDNPSRLRQQLLTYGYTHGSLLDEIIFRIGPHATEREQMPRGGHVPSERQRQELIDYLNGLIADESDN